MQCFKTNLNFIRADLFIIIILLSDFDVPNFKINFLYLVYYASIRFTKYEVYNKYCPPKISPYFVFKRMNCSGIFFFFFFGIKCEKENIIGYYKIIPSKCF